MACTGSTVPSNRKTMVGESGWGRPQFNFSNAPMGVDLDVDPVLLD